MGGVFLSHSSLDKELILRLAIDLTILGFPVWLDAWEMEVGDNFPEEIRAGIDECGFLVLALSPHSVASEWVNTELARGLERERSLCRKFIYPIKLAACTVPVSIKDRIYADFTGSHPEAIEKLAAVLEENGAQNASVPLSRRIVPLVFSNGIHLEKTGFQKQISRIAPEITVTNQIADKQFLCKDDEKLDRLRENLRNLVESYPSHPTYSPDVEQEILLIREQATILNSALPKGIAEITRGLCAMREWAFASEACYWYARRIRSELIAKLERAWRIAGNKEPLYADATNESYLDDRKRMVKVFEISDVLPCTIFSKDYAAYLTLVIDKNSDAGTALCENGMPQTLRSLWSPDLFYKYIVPQMVSQAYFFNRHSTAVSWNFPQWMIRAW